ncbi:MAG: glycosyltransferase [Bacilli bacterium]
MKTALIVLNYNDYDTTHNFITDIKKYKILDLIVIVDNCSTDDSYKKLKKIEVDNIHVVKSDKNGGYGYGNNIGIKYAIKNLGKCNIIISNPDIEVKEKTIEKLLITLNSNDDYAIVGPIINTYGKLDKGWKLTNGFQELLLSIPKYGTKNRNRIIGYKDSYYKKNINEVDVVSGCFFLVKSECLKKINYFDENIFLYYEENIISRKLHNLGYKIVIDMSCEIIHNHSISIDKSHSALSKYKILKESQMYYLNNYTNTSKFTKMLINFICKIMTSHYR